MYLAKFINIKKEVMFRRFKNISPEHLQGKIRGIEKKNNWKHVFTIKESL